MGINFRELKTIRILENRIFRGTKLSRICQNSRKSRKFLPHYFLPLKLYIYIYFMNNLCVISSLCGSVNESAFVKTLF